MKNQKKILVYVLCFLFLPHISISVLASKVDTDEMVIETAQQVSKKGTEKVDLGLQAKSAVLMEASSGTILYEKNATEALSPASITKIMTLILIFDQIDAGKLKLSDMVTTSAYAKSMGGSQVFLEEGEQQDVETMIKCIVIASGNDASVAMAEHIAGSEEEFVRRMNERAKELGMEQTKFEDCCGLTESKSHLTSAKDVAIMSRELITKYPQIFDYSGIWMENITHVTDKGTKEFGLSNTNKLLKMNNSYEVTGLKTGSTSIAKYCLSATARKDGIELIAVVMAAPDYKIRFAEAQTMLNYGYANCQLYQDKEELEEKKISIRNGTKEFCAIEKQKDFSYVTTTGEDVNHVTSKITIHKTKAPVKKGEEIGYIEYFIGEKQIGKIPLLSTETVKKEKYIDRVRKVFFKYLL